MRKKADIYLVLGILLLGFILIAILFLSEKAGERVIVKYDGEIKAEYALDKNAEYIIEGYAGGSLLLHIEDGSVWVTSATCPDKLCENMGTISKTGRSIICLPNRISIEISGKADVDAVVE